MITLILLWGIFLLISFCIGSLLMAVTKPASELRPGDRLVLYLWLGYIFSGIVLLSAALVVPLSPVVGLITILLVTAASLLAAPVRRELAILRQGISAKIFVNGLVLMIAISAISVQTVSNRDSISYQFDIIYWLSRIGVTPGLALIHERLGYVSSWFTVPALFNHDILSGRVATMSNGFALLLVSGHLQISGYRLLTGRAQPVDWFMAFAIPSAMVFPLLLNYPVSPIPDFAVVSLTLIIAWLMFLLSPEGDIMPHSKEVTFRDQNLIPLFLAAGAFTIKIVAAPMVFVAAIFYWASKGFKPQAIMLSGLVTFAVVSPLLIASTILSGCPFDPLPLCLDLPWTVGRDSLPLSSFLPIVWHMYMRPDMKINTVIAGVVFLALCVAALLWILGAHRNRVREIWPILTIGCSGIAFLAVFVPTPRFSWGYLAVIFCSPAILYFNGLQRILMKVGRMFRSDASKLIITLGAVMMFTLPPSMLFRTRSEKRIEKAVRNGTISIDRENQWGLPPVIPKIYFDDVHDLALPKQEVEARYDPLSNGARRMYYPLIPKNRVRYRDPQKGVRAGFIKDSGGVDLEKSIEILGKN